MGTVTFQTIIEKDILGTVAQDTNSMEPGLINYGQQKSIIFFSKDCDPKHIPKLGDKVINIKLHRKLTNIFYFLEKHALYVCNKYLFNFIGNVQYCSSETK